MSIIKKIILIKIMKKSTTSKNTGPVIFESKSVRRTFCEEKWYFVLEDIVSILTESKNPKDYIQKLKTRDEGLSQGWGQIVRILDIDTKGGIQKMNCLDLQGALMTIN